MFKKIINKIKNIISKFKKQPEVNANTKVINDTEEYIRSEVIYNRHELFMVLLSYTPKYFYSIVEFLDACGRIKGINTKLVQSSYDEETDQVDDDGNKIIISHQKYYLLIGGETRCYKDIYDSIESLSNSALETITKDIYNNCHPCHFTELFKYCILDKNLFVHDYSNSIVLDEDTTYMNLDAKIKLVFSNIETILNRLPDGFSAKDLLPFIRVNLKDCGATVTICSAENYIHMCGNSVVYRDREDVLFPIFKRIIKDVTTDKIYDLLLPKYLRASDEDDDFNGTMSDQEIHEIFNQNYYKFNAITTDDIKYASIDEVLVDGEEVYTEDDI